MSNRLFSHVLRLTVAALTVISFTGCAAEDGSDNDAATDEDALAVQPAARLGALQLGDARTVSLAAGARYGAFQFTARAGEAVHASVASSDGSAVVWLTNDSFRSLVKNDRAGAGGSVAIDRTMAKTGTYWVVFAEAKHHAATFTVSLGTAKPPAPPAPTPALASTCNGMPCFSVSGTCWDIVPSQRARQSFANVTFTYAGGPITVDSDLRWHDDGSQSTSDATRRLYAWLRNYQSMKPNGSRAGMSPYWDGTRVDVYASATLSPTTLTFTMDTAGGGSSCLLTAAMK